MKNILLGITSSIAAYKSYELIRLYKKADFNVKTVCTDNALNFISPLILETLSENSCYYKQFEPRENTEHINLCDWADVFVIAPITANTVSKLAKGIADNLLTSICTAYITTKKPFLIAPAMNDNMWNNPIIQENVSALKNFNTTIVEPESGFLACKKEGTGRLADINLIFEETMRAYYQNKNNNSKKIVITIGGTKENIDNVRYISNYSSGKMGYCLADWAYRLGYNVSIISTVDNKKPYKITMVRSADEMLYTLKQEDFDYLIMAAAVADFKVKTIQDKKIIKEDIKDNLTLELIKNPDILSTISNNKRPDQKTIGFCLTDDNIVDRAKEKLKSKRLDYIIANEIETALNTNKNKVTIIDKNGKIITTDCDTKENIAKKILEVVCD